MKGVSELKWIMIEAHKEARKFVEKYDVDYRAQVGISMGFLIRQREINRILKNLGDLRSTIPTQTLKTIRGQAIAGDIKAARKGLNREMKKYKKVI